MSGYKTYLVSFILIFAGVVLAFFVGGTATYANPSGDYGKVVGQMVGSVAILMGLRDMSMRHAIGKVEKLIRGV